MATSRNSGTTGAAYWSGMAPKHPVGRERGDSFIKTMTVICSLGVLWLVVTLAYAAWLGVFG
jgi:hypothetical protein